MASPSMSTLSSPYQPAYTSSSMSGGGLSFDGYDDAVAIDTGFTSLTRGFTLCLWVKPVARNPVTAAGSHRSYIVDFRRGSRHAGYWLIDDNSPSSVKMMIGASDTSESSWPFSVQYGRWQHWCVVSYSDNSNGKFYRDGVLEYTLPNGSPQAMGEAVIG